MFDIYLGAMHFRADTASEVDSNSAGLKIDKMKVKRAMISLILQNY